MKLDMRMIGEQDEEVSKSSVETVGSEVFIVAKRARASVVRDPH